MANLVLTLRTIPILMDRVLVEEQRFHTSAMRLNTCAVNFLDADVSSTLTALAPDV